MWPVDDVPSLAVLVPCLPLLLRSVALCTRLTLALAREVSSTGVGVMARSREEAGGEVAADGRSVGMN